MSYNKKTWANGDRITEQGMNNIEDGIYTAHDEIQTLKNNTFTNVKEYGVVGDGVTDDTAAMQAALNAGGNLYLPDVYLINGELKVKSNTHLLGVPNKTMFKKSQPKYIRESDNNERWTVHLLVGSYGVANSCENVIIENIILDGNGGRSTPDAYDDPSYGSAEIGSKLLECVNANNITVKNVTCQNNNYAGSILYSCTNVLIRDFKSLNCDVGICLLKDDTTDTELRNYTLENIYIDGHDYSEGISLYAKSRIYNVKMNNITILNKAKGTALLVGTEHLGDYGVVDGSISNVMIDGSAIGMGISQDASNIQVNNVNIKNCHRGMLITQSSHDNQITNVNIANTKSHSLYIGPNTYNNTLSNINFRNCNINEYPDYNYAYIVCNGSKCLCDNISLADDNASDKYGIVLSGDENKFSFKNLTKNTGIFKFVLRGRESDGHSPINNIINIDDTKYHACDDRTADSVTSTTNVFNSSYNGICTKDIISGDVLLANAVFDKYKFTVTNNSLAFDLNTITLFEQYKRIFLTISVTGTDSSVTLATGGNIVWKSNDTLTTGQTTNHELICINNQWVEMNRY